MPDNSPYCSCAASQGGCSPCLCQSPDLLTDELRSTLLRQRLECKQQAIERLLALTKQSWNEAFYISLARNFGFHTNSKPFEQLALQTPLPCLLKHRSSLFQLTAILLGQSGLLDPESEPDLWREYAFLRQKFGLIPLDGKTWKLSCVRPQNAPQLRIRQFALLLHQSEFIFSSLMNASTLDEMEQILLIDPQAFPLWPEPLGATARLGVASVRILLINTVLPYRYAWFGYQGKVEEQRAVLAQLSALPAENNTVIRHWRTMGVSVRSAADSQALLQLYETCDRPAIFLTLNKKTASAREQTS